jgi:tetratricopeptide (TPR) repeat protein
MGLEAIQRLRGVQEWRVEPGLDFSSNEIMRYYARQHYESGHFFEKQGLDWLALRQFDEGTGLHPEAFAFNDMAVILGKMDYLSMARRLCVMGMMDDPDYPPVYENLAKCFMKEGNYVEASKVYQEILKILGSSLEPQKKLESAVRLSRAGEKTFAKPDLTKKYEDLQHRLKLDGMPFLSGIARISAWDQNGNQMPKTSK